MLRSILCACLALAAACCMAPQAADVVGIDGKPLVSAEGIVDNSVQDALTADAAACAKVGGIVQPVCRMQKPMCVIAFKDAGKSCTDGSQCASGRCMAAETTAKTGPASGICAETNNPCGCYQRIEDGVALPVLCAD